MTDTECSKCNGEGWLWWYELDNFAGHDPTECVGDDTRYSCDECNKG
jgi:hypothetical protein